MAKDNLTAVLYGIQDLRLEQRPIPKIKNNQVLLKMEVVGICGSDVHYLVEGKIGPFIVKNPMVIGHEASGTVLEIGSEVKHLKPGDRVAIEPGHGCRQCNYCKDGRYNLCLDMIFCATPPYDGNLARFYAHDADFCYKLPDNMSLEEGALMEPLSVGVHACNRAGLKFGQTVLIFGAGPIGLVSLLAAKAKGATRTIIADITDHRLQVAKQLGADHVMKIERGQSEEQLIDCLKSLLDGDEPDVTLECAGAEQCVRIAAQVTKSGGVVTLVGMGASEMTLPLTVALIREVDIRGVFRYVNCYPTAIEMVRSGRVNVKPLITHHFKLEETKEAFQAAQSTAGNPIKILIHPNPDWKP